MHLVEVVMEELCESSSLCSHLVKHMDTHRSRHLVCCLCRLVVPPSLLLPDYQTVT